MSYEICSLFFFFFQFSCKISEDHWYYSQAKFLNPQNMCLGFRFLLGIHLELLWIHLIPSHSTKIYIDSATQRWKLLVSLALFVRSQQLCELYHLLKFEFPGLRSRSGCTIWQGSLGWFILILYILEP